MISEQELLNRIDKVIPTEQFQYFKNSFGLQSLYKRDLAFEKFVNSKIANPKEFEIRIFVNPNKSDLEVYAIPVGLADFSLNPKGLSFLKILSFKIHKGLNNFRKLRLGAIRLGNKIEFVYNEDALPSGKNKLIFDVYISNGFQNSKLDNETKFVAILHEIGKWANSSGYLSNFSWIVFYLTVDILIILYAAINGITLVRELVFDSDVVQALGEDKIFVMLLQSGLAIIVVITLFFYLATSLFRERILDADKFVKGLGYADELIKFIKKTNTQPDSFLQKITNTVKYWFSVNPSAEKRVKKLILDHQDLTLHQKILIFNSQKEVF